MRILCLSFLALLLLGTSVGVCAQCPPDMPPGINCLAGADAHGAFYLIGVPANYNGRLVLFNHGYTLTPPARSPQQIWAPGCSRSARDLRWRLRVFVRTRLA
jgi:hypothetical protein